MPFSNFDSLLSPEHEEIIISPPRCSQKRPRSPSTSPNRTSMTSPLPSSFDVKHLSADHPTTVVLPPLSLSPTMTATTTSPSTKRRRVAIVWFRRDLRLHDNLAMDEALKKFRQVNDPSMLLIPIYIIHKPKQKRCGAVRFQFLIESIEDLSKQLIAKQNQLIVLRGDALQVFETILPAWKVTDLFFDEYVMPYALKKDQDVIQLAQSKYQIQVHTTKGLLLYNPHEIIQRNQGKVPLDFDHFCKILSEMEQPSPPIPTPTQIDGYIQDVASPQKLYELLYEYFNQDKNKRKEIDLMAYGPVDQRCSEDRPFSVPKNVKEFGLEPPKVHSFLYGGETKALEALANFCKCEERVGLFDKPRTSPALVDEPSTTALSPYMAFGCVSPREFFYQIMFIELRYPGVKGPASVTLDGQLMWREFFYCFAIGTPHFDRQKRNAQCLQVKWRLLELPDTCTSSNEWDEETQQAMEHYACWMEGRTGFPWIDAIMKQIVQEGWAHHLARHAIACFLTRGDLYIAWERGAEFMQQVLIDLDWPLNVGNWLWISASCFYHDYTTIHSPTTFPQAWDKTGNFIRKYVPALSKMPERYIFEPWKAPLSVQRKSGCLIGKDYPFPIVDHHTAKKKCIDWLRAEYERNQYGNPQEEEEEEDKKEEDKKEEVSCSSMLC